MLTTPLTTKQPDGILAVIVIGPLSKPKDIPEETPNTVDSTIAFAQQFIERHYKGPVRYKLLGEQFSAKVLDQSVIIEAAELMATGEWDVLIAENLSRICRNPLHQYNFVQNCVDVGTRLICIADSLDTADQNWETMVSLATLRHWLSVPDTRRRIKRTARGSSHGGDVC